MLQLGEQDAHVPWVGLLDMLPQGHHLGAQLPGRRDGVVDVGDMVLLRVALLQLGEVDGVGLDGVDDVEQELAVGDSRVLQVLDVQLGRHLAVAPRHQLLVVDLAHSLLPVDLADLPDQAQGQTGLAIDDVDAVDTN